MPLSLGALRLISLFQVLQLAFSIEMPRLLRRDVAEKPGSMSAGSVVQADEMPAAPPMNIILKCCSTTPRQATAMQKNSGGKWAVSCKESSEAGESQTNIDATCEKVIQQVASSLATESASSNFEDGTIQQGASASVSVSTTLSPPQDMLRKCCGKSPKEVPVAKKMPNGGFEFSCSGSTSTTDTALLADAEVEKVCSDSLFEDVPEPCGDSTESDKSDDSANKSDDSANKSDDSANKSNKENKIPRKILDHNTMTGSPAIKADSKYVLAPPEVTEKCCTQTPKMMPAVSKTSAENFTCKGAPEASQTEVNEACSAYGASPWKETNLPAASLQLVKSCCGRKYTERPVQHYWPSGAVTYSCEGESAGWSKGNIDEVCANMTKCAERASNGPNGPSKDKDGALSKRGNQGRNPPPTPDLVLQCCSKSPREAPVPSLQQSGSFSYDCSGPSSNLTDTSIQEICEFLAIDSQVYQPKAKHPCESNNCTNLQMLVPPTPIVNECCKDQKFPIGLPTDDHKSLTFTCVGATSGLSHAQITQNCEKFGFKEEAAEDSKK
jgi:hypothetical protein